MLEIFGQPEEVTHTIPEHDGETNIKVISPDHFLARVYQIGITDLTELQVACLMRVLSKPEFDDFVRLDELE